jgi:hypothetical protein
METKEVYIIYKDGEMWAGARYQRKVRAYTTKGIANGVMKREAELEAKRIVREEKKISYFDEGFDKEFEITLDNELSRYEVKTFVEKI